MEEVGVSGPQPMGMVETHDGDLYVSRIKCHGQ